MSIATVFWRRNVHNSIMLFARHTCSSSSTHLSICRSSASQKMSTRSATSSSSIFVPKVLTETRPLRGCMQRDMHQQRHQVPQQEQIDQKQRRLHNYVSKRYPEIYSKLVLQTKAKHPNMNASSLFASFLILHELTAIVPLLVLLIVLHYLDAGQKILDFVNVNTNLVSSSLPSPSTTPLENDPSPHSSKDRSEPTSFWTHKIDSWTKEGLRRVDRILNKYYFKEDPNSSSNPLFSASSNKTALLVDGLAAYLIVKALFPFRIGLCFYLSPKLANVTMSRIKNVRSYMQPNNTRN